MQPALPTRDGTLKGPHLLGMLAAGDRPETILEVIPGSNQKISRLASSTLTDWSGTNAFDPALVGSAA